jgi:hypothetical protein
MALVWPGVHRYTSRPKALNISGYGQHVGSVAAATITQQSNFINIYRKAAACVWLRHRSTKL